MTLRRVAIVGIGAITGFGLTASALWDGIAGARSAIRPIHNMPSGQIDRVAGEISGYVVDEHFESKSAAMLDRVSQIAVVAAREAIAQAGLSHDDISALRHRAGVRYGASPGQVTLDNGYLALYDKKVPRLHPFTVPRILPAGPAAAIAIEAGAHGACFATASACATGTHSIGLCFDMIRLGRLDIAIGGGSDASIVFGYVKAWEALRLLANDTPRPFSLDRTGLVLGEGAAALVLEEWEHARARGAAILAEVVGFGMSCDAADMVAPDAGSAAVAMQAALDDARLAPGDIGYINAHGTGTRANDKTEVAAMHMVFGDHIPPVSSLKSQLGHTLNAAGGIETVATVLALQAQIMPATIGFRTYDPECDIDCVANTPRPAAFNYALMNSLGFGGLNAVLALRRADPSSGIEGFRG